jgi:hypothetical protein
LDVSLKNIQVSPEYERVYNVLWHLVVSFFDDIKITGEMSVAIIDRSGSFIQQSQIIGSDLDVPVVLNPSTKLPVDFLKPLEDIARRRFVPGTLVRGFSQSAGAITFSVQSVTSSRKAVHIDFAQPFECGVDIVPMTEAHYRKEMERVQRYRDITPLQRDAAKIVKYTVKTFSPGEVSSYEIVAAALECKKTTISNCVNHLVRCFSDRLDVSSVLGAIKDRINNVGR